MKTNLTPALAALTLFGSAVIGHCDLIKAGTTYHRDFLAYDTSGNNLTASAASTFTVQQSVAGAAPIIITPTITYKGAGHFDLVYTPALDATPGSSAIIITAPGATQVDLNDQVVGFDPASDLGAAALATANTGIAGNGTAIAGVAPAVWTQPARTLTGGTTPPDYLNAAEKAQLLLASTAQQAGQPVTLPSTVLSAADLAAVQQAIMTYALHTGVSFQKAVAQIYLNTAGASTPTKSGTVQTNPFQWPDGAVGLTSTTNSSTGQRTETPGTLPN